MVNEDKNQIKQSIDITETLLFCQFYSHAYVNTRETWTHENQPNAV